MANGSPGRPKKSVTTKEAPEEKLQDAPIETADMPDPEVKEEKEEIVSKGTSYWDNDVKEDLEKVEQEETASYSYPSSACADCPYTYKNPVCKSCIENIKESE